MTEIVHYLTTNIFKQPSLFMGLITCIGLVVQKKSIENIIKGTARTIIGVIILFVGVNLIGTTVSPLSTAFGTLYNVPKVNQFDPNLSWEYLGTMGSTIGLVMVIAFAINLLVARVTPIKNIFLTGHIFFWMSYIFVLAGVEAGLSGTGLVVFSVIFLSAYIILVPWATKPHVKKITGSDDFTVGHTAGFFIILGGIIGKFVGDATKSTEDIKIPKALNFLKDTTISTSIIMFILYIVVGLLIGEEARVEVFGSAVGSINTIGGMQYDLFTFSLMAGLTFGAGFTILLTGVRLMIGELIPAFKGISERLIPNAIPALDVPVIFSFAPNALMIGFIFSMIASIGTILVLATTGNLHYAVIPLVIACFYDVAPGAISANARGGKVAAIITSIVGGVLHVGLIAFSLKAAMHTAAGFLQIYGGNDFSLWTIIAKWFAGLFA